MQKPKPGLGETGRSKTEAEPLTANRKETRAKERVGVRPEKPSPMVIKHV
jgi:hypothetical protein